MEDIPGNTATFVGSLFFTSPYSIEKIKQGNTFGVAAGIVSPPFSYVGDVIKDATEIITGDFEAKDSKTIRNVPVIGEAIQFLVFGKREENAREEHIRRIKAGKSSNYRR